MGTSYQKAQIILVTMASYDDYDDVFDIFSDLFQSFTGTTFNTTAKSSWVKVKKCVAMIFVSMINNFFLNDTVTAGNNEISHAFLSKEPSRCV